MKMEKRALLAFVASILLFVAYDYFYLGPRVKEQRRLRAVEMERQQEVTDSLAAIVEAEAPQAGASQPEASGESQPVAEDTAAVPAEGGQAQAEGERVPQRAVAAAEFTVVSPLYEITLTTAGAEIVSVKLRDYETKGEPVQLIARDTEWTLARALNVTLEGRTASLSLTSLSFAAYQDGVGEPLANGSAVTVSQSRESTEIVFRASQNGKGPIER
jgi:YidC/Oxa1 family membrane protein insertase